MTRNVEFLLLELGVAPHIAGAGIANPSANEALSRAATYGVDASAQRLLA